MELNKMIKELMDSGMIENESLAVTLLTSDQVSDEEKQKYLFNFIEEYTHNPAKFFEEENKGLLRAWVELYLPTIKDNIKNRVKKIE